jgi:hypothetical protein
MKHPGQTELALFAGGDLPLLPRLRIRAHLRTCDGCRHELEAFRAAAEELRRESRTLPERFDWDRIAAEMTANIHLGVEAGECVSFHSVRRHWAGWRTAAIVAAVSAVLVAAWILNPPRRPESTLRASHAAEIRNTENGLELNENGNALVLLHGRDVQAQRPIIVSAPGALRARFVDSDTGQITITHVYAE